MMIFLHFLIVGDMIEIIIVSENSFHPLLLGLKMVIFSMVFLAISLNPIELSIWQAHNLSHLEKTANGRAYIVEIALKSVEY